MTGLSDFDLMVARLVNWARWGRQDSNCPDPEAVTAGIYDMGRADRQGEGESGEDAEGPADPIDHQDGQAISDLIDKLGDNHKWAIRVYFYKRKPVYRPLVDEAVRALCDLEDANQRVNQRMRRR
jgi:hypothetical protein